MPSQTFTPGSYNFDHVGKTNIRFVIRSAGGNGTVGDGSGNEGGNGGGGGGACVIGSIPDAHLAGAANVTLDVPHGGSNANALIQINGGFGDGSGIYVTSGGENSAGGSGGDLDGDELGWCASARQGGSGSSIGGDTGGGGGGAGTPDGDGLGADGNGGGVDGSGNPSGGNGGYELTPGQNAYGIGGGGGGGTFYGDPVTSAPAGSGGDGQITLTWDAVGVAQLQTLSTGITTGL